ncbi:hypothetical protein [Methylobacterium brachythecii]|uniref:Chemotaxis protein CheZ n=1 Tax=Methylobacterium brachythecii TaxID=1176177 RepID=A0A7W6APH7_9HYPH|nr:hypothetical protein [Methylobacterium brachythecii]MBB3904890.1 hypothetical protein [Methylobacterium brachythecii]GLS47055.1 hypothetical protein GCM10007884_50570 [Methylobacterium brachythecii]
MMSSGSPSQIDETEYDVIEGALAETERGRRFLAEFARRHRGADTETLLQAIHRLEGVVTRDAETVAGSDGLQGEIAAMAESLGRMRVAIAVVASPEGGGAGHPTAPETLDTLVRTAERTTSDILGAAEAIQEAAWGLREKGAEGALCDELDRRAMAIYTACSAQDLTTQRVGLAVAALRDLETRIGGLIGREVASDEPSAPMPLPLPPALPEEDDLDFVPSAAGAEPTQAESAAPAAIAEPDDADDLALAFGDLDRLSIEEKIALFS